MARYEVCALRSGGLVLDVQSDLLDLLNTRVVVPLMPPATAPKPAQRLNPVFDLDGQKMIMVTQYLSAVMAAELGPPTAALDSEAATIGAALDMLFLGF